MFLLPTPHGDKLEALAQNKKLPVQDVFRVEQILLEYKEWRKQLEDIHGTTPEIVTRMISLLNAYRWKVDVDLIFDSENDFLYRQKGQIKLDNSVIEEFLPLLIKTVFAEQLQNYDLSLGPTTCFSGIRFESAIMSDKPGGGMQFKEKNHDFAISRKLFIRSSHQADFRESVTDETYIAYAVAECKTNLDKTMFQESAATALDVKTVVPGARYYLLCEWLDMIPLSTRTTAIDEIIILRKAKRLASNIRSQFNTFEGRRRNREIFTNYLKDNPFQVETFSRFITHIKNFIEINTEIDVLDRGYF
ncbi:MAG: Bpu10I family restriction endonuclease [Deltaproteobacteria bacterium]|nr:MAG: Bpu10I family restriction endonuclease [Deltaproteobacteria bacterium]